MSPGQATGAAISYARKYALGGMFAIDNEKDLDSPEYQQSRKDANNTRQDATKQAALKGLNERVKALNLSTEYVTNIIHRQYNKANSKEMTAEEVADLSANLQKYVDMGMGA
jgi:plasmid replication initiation protein